MKLLVTGFEPFGQDAENASERAMGALVSRWLHVGTPGVEVVGVRLPVVFDARPLLDAVARHRPDRVLCLGEAGGRVALTPERFGVNLMDARIPDNAGRQPRGVPVEPGGPERRTATWDPEPFARAMSDAGWVSRVSDDAGRFVCNSTAYVAYGLGVPALFCHVPALRTDGVATVGAETDPAGPVGAGSTGGLREPHTAGDLADALAAGLRASIT